MSKTSKKILFIFVLISFTFLPAFQGQLNQLTTNSEQRESNFVQKIFIPSQIGSAPVAIYTNVQFQEQYASIDYYVQNMGNEPIHALYILNEGIDLISNSDSLMPPDWETSSVTYIDVDGISYSYKLWNTPLSNPLAQGIIPGETAHFSITAFMDYNEYTIAPGIWSVSNFTASESFFSDPGYGQIANSTEYDGNIDSYALGVSMVPTILHVDPICRYPHVNSTFSFYQASIGVQTPSGKNLTKDIDPQLADQHWTNAGQMGCLPTSTAYSLGWWGNNGVAPRNHTEGAKNPINTTSFDDMIELANKLAKATGTTEKDGVKLENFTNGLRKWLKDNDLPLNLSFYDFTKQINGSKGVPGPDTIFEEFMDNREDVIISVISSQGSHALTVIGVNTTRGPKGYEITVLDPDTGQPYTTYMNALYFTGSKWTNQPKGNETYSQIEYHGRWLAINGLWAISPSNPSGTVADSTNSTNNKFFNQKINIKAKMTQLNNATKYSYHVKPNFGSGALIESFILQTALPKDFTNLIIDFRYPDGWDRIIKENDHGLLDLYFFNNKILGGTAQHLPLSGGIFEYLFLGTNTSYGDWYISHSGLPSIDKNVEDGSYNYRENKFEGKVIVPALGSSVEQSDDLTSNLTSTSTIKPASSSSVSIPLYISLLTLFSVVWLRKRKFY